MCFSEESEKYNLVSLAKASVSLQTLSETFLFFSGLQSKEAHWAVSWRKHASNLDCAILDTSKENTDDLHAGSFQPCLSLKTMPQRTIARQTLTPAMPSEFF